MAVHNETCLCLIFLIVAISAVSSAPQQQQQQQKTQTKEIGGTASVAQAKDPKCLQPKEPGPCRMNLGRFYYNAQTNACEPFKFGGCRGNDNKFGFLKTCEDACVNAKSTANNVPSTTSKAPAAAVVPKIAANVPAVTKTQSVALPRTG